ncbi:hypothetical protein K1719_014869 [Acacia pycnantha]|nr:hypothetical protein K1719_014869 [Acacia pycnantha]
MLANFKNNEVDCTLFDKRSRMPIWHTCENLESPVVVSLNLARVGFYEDEKYLCSAKDEKSPIMVGLSQTMTSQLSQHSNGASLYNQTKVTISQIPEQAIGDSFVIHCQIHKLETKYDWIYDGCPKCGSKVKSDDPSWICPLCKKQPEPKMKLHYLVRDKTGSVSVIFWDKLAVQLVKKTASELKCLVKEMNDFNKKHPTSSISVVQYTICEDLLDQFSEASTRGFSLVNYSCSLREGCSEVKATVESVDAESVTPLVTTLDQSTISDLSQHVTPTPIKGKRRITNKRNGDKDDLTTTSHVFSVGPTEERVTKVIKQEK